MARTLCTRSLCSTLRWVVLAAATSLWSVTAWPMGLPDTSTLADDLYALRVEAGALVGAVAVIGLRDWNWGSSPEFRIRHEGWFGSDTESGGMDKLGHAYSAYLLTNGLTERLVEQGRTAESAARSAALLTQGLLLGVELFDGYSTRYGFSTEDLSMNLLGSAWAVLRQSTPKLRERIDFRLAYQPSGYHGWSPLGDYAGHSYLMALKLSGFEATRRSPLRYLELHLGYRARGFSPEELSDGRTRSRQGFAGVGINLSELLWGPATAADSRLRRNGRLLLEHLQWPGGAWYPP
ncbi:MAG: DUF2279 domain-containing protein [Rhodoferax sp.]|nr:DUF2279 domain-containing protein [Rhodoferax sp.]